MLRKAEILASFGSANIYITLRGHKGVFRLSEVDNHYNGNNEVNLKENNEVKLACFLIYELKE